MKIGFHFPGQGSQSLGMLSQLATEFSIVEELFEKASNVLNYDLWLLTQDGPEEKLNKTEYTQPALLAADFAVWSCWQSLSAPLPHFLAGHSLGEYAALVAAEVLTFEQAIELVALRGKAMQSAVAEGQGAMAAIIGLDDHKVFELCEAAAKGQVVSPANYNSIGQIVIAGDSKAVDRAIELAKSSGAKMAKRIPVSVPSHCALMRPAADELAKKLKQMAIAPPKIPVIHNVDVSIHSQSQEIVDALVEQLVFPVRWVETVEKMSQEGASLFIECGPGKVLAGLNKRITKQIPTESLHTKENMEAVLKKIGEQIA